MSGGEELSSALQNAVDSLARLSRALARRQQQQGRPAIIIDKEQLRALLEFHYSIMDIGKIFPGPLKDGT